MFQLQLIILLFVIGFTTTDGTFGLKFINGFQYVSYLYIFLLGISIFISLVLFLSTNKKYKIDESLRGMLLVTAIVILIVPIFNLFLINEIIDGVNVSASNFSELGNDILIFVWVIFNMISVTINKGSK